MKRSVTAAAALAAVIAFLASHLAAAQDASGPTLGGSVLEQAYGSYSGSGAFSAGDFGYGSSTTLGLNLDVKGQRARASASLETAVFDGEAAQVAWLVAKNGYAPTDELFVPAVQAVGVGSPPNLLMAFRVRTLYVKLDADWVSLTAGRQVINYERGALWSPADIFTELDLTGLSPVRLGSDALRFTFPFGTTSDLDIAAAPGTIPADGIYSARLSGLVLGVDGALSAARDGAARASYFGADFKADLEVGFYGDISYALPDSGALGSCRAAGGADWSTGDFIFAAEYYYNGGGVEADPLFPGLQNLYGEITWRATEFLSVSPSIIWDLSDNSGTGTLLVSLWAAQNATLVVYGKAIWGEGTGTFAGSAGLIGGIATVAGQLGATITISF
jgi:hypothetical protein